MKRFSVILISLLTAIIIAIALSWTKEDYFITNVGDYRLKGLTTYLTVYEHENGSLALKTTDPDSEHTWADGWIDPNKPWFIYVDKYNELWLSNDNHLTYIYSFDKHSGIYSVNEYPHAEFKDSTLIEIIPDEVMERLPQTTLDKLPLQNKTLHPIPSPSRVEPFPTSKH